MNEPKAASSESKKPRLNPGLARASCAKNVNLPKSEISVFKAIDIDVVICAKNRAEMLERVLRQTIHEGSFNRERTLVPS